MSSDDLYAQDETDPGSSAPCEDGKETREVGDHRGATPRGTERRRKRPWICKPYPLVTWSLVLVLIAVQVTLELLGNQAAFWAVENLGQDRVKIWEGELWRLFTCNFIHGGRTHLLFNLLALALFGKAVERWLGGLRFLSCYFFFTLMGSLAYQAFAREGTGIGASGAVCGLIGIFLAGRLGRKEDDHLVLGLRFYIWFLLTCALLWGESSLWELSGLSIADSAHFGGLFSGVLAALYFFSRPGDPAQGVVGRRKLAGAGACVLTLGLGIYAIGWPFMDWSWYLWRSGVALERGDEEASLAARGRARELGGDRAALQIIVQKILVEDRLEEAISYWNKEPLEDTEHQAAAGFRLYSALYYERGYCREVEILLDRLIALTDQAMEEKGSSRSLLNQAAWYRALLRKDLDTALDFARQALDMAPRDRAVMNTLGWVHFRRSETEEATKYLTAAVRDDDDGGFDLVGALGLRPPSDNEVHLLYLALAYFEWHRWDDARRMVDRLGRNNYADRWFMLHEVRLLDELEETLGNTRPGPPEVINGRSRRFRK